MELVDYWKILDIASIFRGRSWRANIYAVEPVNNSHPRDWSKWPLCTGDRYRQVGYNMRSSRDLLNVVVIAGSTAIYIYLSISNNKVSMDECTVVVKIVSGISFL